MEIKQEWNEMVLVEMGTRGNDNRNEVMVDKSKGTYNGMRIGYNGGNNKGSEWDKMDMNMSIIKCNK